MIEAQLFVAVLGASSYTYAEATWTQGLLRTFAFIGGSRVDEGNMLPSLTAEGWASLARVRARKKAPSAEKDGGEARDIFSK